MAKRLVIHVAGSRGNWEVKEEGRSKPLSTHSKKPEALSAARKAVKGKELAQIKVHGSNGRIQQEFTYGDDPRRIKG